MDLDAQIQLIGKPPTEEVVTAEELRTLLDHNSHPNHYVGVEISGPLHLGTLLINGFKINDFIKAGLRSKVFLADWHSYINNKFGGDWDKIKKVANYYEEAFKFFCPGVEVVYGSDLYHNNDEYWKNIVRFAKRITLSRNARCLTIMGRSEKEKLDFSQYLYPPMQAVDIRAMDLDLVHAGMDQRKVHMLAREVFPSLGWKKPVAVHHHLLPGLSRPTGLGIDQNSEADARLSSKMSKSKMETALFIHDPAKEIRKKINNAWCPDRISDNNPILELAKYIVFHESDELEVDRLQKFGGAVSFSSYDGVEKAYLDGALHPSDLKSAVGDAVNAIVAPLRKHFEGRSGLNEILRPVR